MDTGGPTRAATPLAASACRVLVTFLLHSSNRPTRGASPPRASDHVALVALRRWFELAFDQLRGASCVHCELRPSFRLSAQVLSYALHTAPTPGEPARSRT